LATVHFSVLLFHSPVPTAAYTLSLHDALPISLTYYDQVDDEDESETSHMLNLAGDYQLSPKTTLNASAQAGFEWETEEESTNFFELDAARDPLFNYRRLTVEDQEGWNADFRLGLTHNLAGVATRRASGGFGGGRGGFRGGFGGRGGGPPSGAGGNGASHTISMEARFDASANNDEEL